MKRLTYLACVLSGVAAGCDDTTVASRQVYAASSDRIVAEIEHCLRGTESQIAFADAKLDSVRVWRTSDLVIKANEGISIQLDADPLRRTSIVVSSPNPLTSAQVDVLRKCAEPES